jgi:hypothetical protein
VSRIPPETPPDLSALRREKTRLRQIGIIVLLLGLFSAGLVYELGRRSGGADLAQYEQATTRAESRQMQMLYGTSGGLMEDFLNALKRPGTQALAIVGLTALIAAACFYLSRPLPEADDAE